MSAVASRRLHTLWRIRDLITAVVPTDPCREFLSNPFWSHAPRMLVPGGTLHGPEDPGRRSRASRVERDPSRRGRPRSGIAVHRYCAFPTTSPCALARRLRLSSNAITCGPGGREEPNLMQSSLPLAP